MVFRNADNCKHFALSTCAVHKRNSRQDVLTLLVGRRCRAGCAGDEDGLPMASLAGPCSENELNVLLLWIMDIDVDIVVARLSSCPWHYDSSVLQTV